MHGWWYGRLAGGAYSTAELLAILETAPERISPNALLRPVFQDTILPTAAYVGGPAEIAYFAQSAVVYEAISGADYSGAAAVERDAAGAGDCAVMEKHEVQPAGCDDDGGGAGAEAGCAGDAD